MKVFMHFHIDVKTQRAIKKHPLLAKDIVQSYDEKQIECKTWLVDHLQKIDFFPERIYIAGSWYGNIIVPKLLNIYPEVKKIFLHDIDNKVVKISRNIFFKDIEKVSVYAVDCNSFLYHDMLINTSCEHMEPLNIKKGTFVALQSNNYKNVKDHINCVSSCDELAAQYGLIHQYYSGELRFEKYTRYMVIGKV